MFTLPGEALVPDPSGGAGSVACTLVIEGEGLVCPLTGARWGLHGEAVNEAAHSTPGEKDFLGMLDAFVAHDNHVLAQDVDFFPA
jgi:hypothetical protein